MKNIVKMNMLTMALCTVCASLVTMWTHDHPLIMYPLLILTILIGIIVMAKDYDTIHQEILDKDIRDTNKIIEETFKENHISDEQLKMILERIENNHK